VYGQAVQFLVQDGNQLLFGAVIAVLNSVEQLRDVDR
jgi:hypothetical protein